MKAGNILVAMHLAGQVRRRQQSNGRNHRRDTEGGYAMVALLVGLSVASILMTAAMPVWKQMARREKEAELVFRGKQYARAIELFQRKQPGALPPNLDVLIEQKYLRQRYKDPITNDDFALVRQGQGTAGAPPGAAPGSRGATGGQQPPTAGGQPRPGFGQPGGVVGGIMGVASKSTDPSLLVYNGRTKYNEWQFIYVAQTQTPGAVPGGPGPRRGGPQGPPGPGQRGPGGPGRSVGGPGRGGPAPMGPPRQGGPAIDMRTAPGTGMPFPPGGPGAPAPPPRRP
jgi:type II secretory pathway pseudopilin PulG